MFETLTVKPVRQILHRSDQLSGSFLMLRNSNSSPLIDLVKMPTRFQKLWPDDYPIRLQPIVVELPALIGPGGQGGQCVVQGWRFAMVSHSEAGDQQKQISTFTTTFIAD